MACDPNFADVVSLIPGTSLADTSPVGGTVTAQGNAAVSSGQQLFGLNTLYTGTTGASGIAGPAIVTASDLANIAEWTIEIAAYTPTDGPFLIIGERTSGSFPYGLQLDVSGGGTAFDVTVRGATAFPGGGNVLTFTTTGLNTGWHQYAVCKYANGTYQLFIDGVASGASGVFTGPYTSWLPGFFTLGCYYDSNAAAFGNTLSAGYVANLRVTSSIARYTSTYTPPTAPFGAACAATPYQTAVLADSPASYVPGNETSGLVHDIIQNTVWTTGTSFPTLGNAAPAGLGTALGFIKAASSDCAWPNPFVSPNNPGTPAAALTVEWWFSSTDTVPATGGLGMASVAVFCDISGAGQSDYGAGYSGPMHAAWAIGQPSDPRIDSPAAYNDGNWHHVVGTWDGATGDAQLYVDAVLVNTASGTWHIGTIAGNTLWGAGFNSSPVQMLQNNMAIYPSVLSPARITAHYLLGSGGTVVPDVVGLPQAAAEAAIVAAAYTVGTETSAHDAVQPVGSVVSQNPAAGAHATPGSNVDLVLSLGLVVPNVVNTSLDPVAPTILAAAGFVVGAVTYESSVLVIAGNVVKQSPAAGTNATGGSGVNLVVSTGRGPCVVPFIVEDTQADADTAIINIGLIVGTVTFRSSLTVPAGDVIAQNPQGGTPVAYGTLVSYVISTGPAPVPPLFDWNATVISQFANSPTLLQLCSNVAGYVDQTANFAEFFEFVWNVDTAQGFGLDVWGHIVNVSRLLQIPTAARYVGFQDGTGPGTGTDVEPFGQKGTWFTPLSATEAYLLEDEPYRQLILTKALANIVNTTVPAFNQLLQNLFPGRGNPYVVNDGTMNMKFVFDFDLTPIELAILEQSGAVPVPPGVSFTIVVP